MLALALWSCSGDEPTPRPTAETAGSTAETGGGPACSVDDALKVRCRFRRDGPGTLTLALAVPDEPERTFDGDPEALDGELVGWDVPTDVDLVARVVDRGRVVVEETVHSPLPDAARIVVDVLVDGRSSLDRVVFPFGCDDQQPHLMAVDAGGRVRWLQPVGEGIATVPALLPSGRGTILAIPRRTALREWRWDGTPVLDLSHDDGGLPRLVHHAIDVAGDTTFVLDATTELFPDGQSYLVDGVTQVDTEGVATHVWDTNAILDPQGLKSPPAPSYWYQYLGAVDGVHENSIDVLADGSWILSLKHLETVVKVGLDGQVVWSLAGIDQPRRFADLRLDTSGSVVDPHFEYPHHPNLSPWGTLLVFDNGHGIENSRVVEFELDEGARAARAIRDWDLGAICPVQSSVVGLADGTVLAMCARTRELYELDDTGIRRRTRFTCEDGGGAPIVRAYPTTLRD